MCLIASGARLEDNCLAATPWTLEGYPQNYPHCYFVHVTSFLFTSKIWQSGDEKEIFRLQTILKFKNLWPMG